MFAHAIEAENFSRVHNRYTAILQQGGRYLNWEKTAPFPGESALAYDALPMPAEVRNSIYCIEECALLMLR